MMQIVKTATNAFSILKFVLKKIKKRLSFAFTAFLYYYYMTLACVIVVFVVVIIVAAV